MDKHTNTNEQPEEFGLKMIPISQLHPHPDNPRKELGDLTELADSIRERGVMQNLTVVPYGDGYRILIGHRRCSAARLAGLTELPCAVVEMSKEEQVATMLLENMQRSDLTAYEQAEGFQMMLDFGESIASVAKKTGFSETTIRRRIKLCELDREQLKKVSGRQISMEDIDSLSKIKDVGRRNIVLRFIGTANFYSEYKKAMDAQKDKEKREKWTAECIRRGMKEIPYSDVFTNKYTYHGYITTDKPFSDLDKFNGSKQYYFCYSHGAVYIRGEKSGELSEEDKEKAAEQARFAQKRAALQEAAARAYELRSDFIKSYSTSMAKKHVNDAILMLIQRAWTPDCYTQYDASFYADALGAEYKGNAKNWNLVSFETVQHPEYALICHAYAAWGDSASMNYHDHINTWRDNIHLNQIYAFLEKLGYNISDEERELRDGTHELFEPLTDDVDEDEDDE